MLVGYFRCREACTCSVPPWCHWPKIRTGLKYNSQSQALKPKWSKKVVIGLVKFFSKRSIKYALEGLYLEARYKTRHKLESNISLQHQDKKFIKKLSHSQKNMYIISMVRPTTYLFNRRLFFFKLRISCRLTMISASYSCSFNSNCKSSFHLFSHLFFLCVLILSTLVVVISVRPSDIL